jgi:hypothetical protein
MRRVRPGPRLYGTGPDRPGSSYRLRRRDDPGGPGQKTDSPARTSRAVSAMTWPRNISTATPRVPQTERSNYSPQSSLSAGPAAADPPRREPILALTSRTCRVHRKQPLRASRGRRRFSLGYRPSQSEPAVNALTTRQLSPRHGEVDSDEITARTFVRQHRSQPILSLSLT